MMDRKVLQEVVEELFRSEMRDFVLRSLRLSELDIVPVPNFTIPYLKADRSPLQLRLRVGDEVLTYKSMKAIALLRYRKKMLVSKEDKNEVLQRWYRGDGKDIPENTMVITVRDVLFWEPENKVLFIYQGVGKRRGEVEKVFNLERRAYCLIEPKAAESGGRQYAVPVITPILNEPVSLSGDFLEDLSLIQEHISWRLGLAEESPIYRAILDRLNLRAEIEEEEVSPEEEEDIAF
ncbi:MAG: hypothetical protein ACO2PP_04210 [Thermocrinis sp.]|jgi:hypothetical protein|uniref:hypothetical protein n=1 Tax=Thermocrinis sp. TaxID=2024383 RepID=UPI003BFFA8D7